jgi:hypothetical protein
MGVDDGIFRSRQTARSDSVGRGAQRLCADNPAPRDAPFLLLDLIFGPAPCYKQEREGRVPAPRRRAAAIGSNKEDRL